MGSRKRNGKIPNIPNSRFEVARSLNAGLGGRSEALAIKYKDPRKLKPRPKNPRTHTARQIKQVVASIPEFGFINPVLVDGSDGIVAGHARVAAAVSMGMNDIHTVRADHPSPAQIGPMSSPIIGLPKKPAGIPLSCSRASRAFRPTKFRRHGHWL